MRGCRALEMKEVDQILDACMKVSSGSVGERNRAIFPLMLTTGLRISEALSLRIGDVYDGNHITEVLYLQRRFSKSKQHGSHMPIHPKTKDALWRWLLYTGATNLPANYPLFPPSYGGNTAKPLYYWGKAANNRTIRKSLDTIRKKLHLGGRVSTHSFRKTFAKRMYELMDNDLLKTQKALRHSQVSSTICYLQVNEEEVLAAVGRFF